MVCVSVTILAFIAGLVLGFCVGEKRAIQKTFTMVEEGIKLNNELQSLLRDISEAYRRRVRTILEQQTDIDPDKREQLVAEMIPSGEIK